MQFGFVIASIVKVEENNGYGLELNIHDLYKKNIITTTGLQIMASRRASDAPSGRLFSHIAYGTGTTLAEAISNSALETEIYRVALDNWFASGATMYGAHRLVATDIGAGSYGISEIGLYDASGGGNLIARQLFDSVATITGAERIDVLWGIVDQNE